jgi:hypothetical protein
MKTKTLLVILIVILVVLAILVAALGPLKKKEEKPEIFKEIYGFSAEIKEIGEKTLTLEALIPLTNGEPAKKTIKVVITDQTKIFKLKFPEEIPVDSAQTIRPEEEEIKIGELKVGDKVDIGTSINVAEQIRKGSAFEVNQIFISK